MRPSKKRVVTTRKLETVNRWSLTLHDNRRKCQNVFLKKSHINTFQSNEKRLTIHISFSNCPGFVQNTNLAHSARAVTLRVDSQLSLGSSKRCNWARSQQRCAALVDAANHYSVYSQLSVWTLPPLRYPKNWEEQVCGRLRIAKKTSDAFAG